MGDMDVTNADQVSVSVGDTITVRLQENASTGYVWSVAELGDGMSVDGEAMLPPGDAAPGAGGQHVVTVRAERAGEWPLVLRLARQWEPDAAQERRIAVTVV